MEHKTKDPQQYKRQVSTIVISSVSVLILIGTLLPDLSSQIASIVNAIITIALTAALVWFFPRVMSLLSGGIFILVGLAFLSFLTAQNGHYMAGVVQIFLLAMSSTVFGVSVLVLKIRQPTRRHPDSQMLTDTHLYGARFDFAKGVVTEENHWDIKLDLPNGLVSNAHPTNGNPEPAGFMDLNTTNFNHISNAPQTDYVPTIPVKDIKEGSCYCVKLSTRQEYAKIQIIKFDPASKYIRFRWRLFENRQA